MQKLLILLSVLILTNGRMLLADIGSGESSAGSLTSMPPSPPTLNTPTNGATSVISLELAWNATGHATSYNLQASTASDFTSTVADETGLTGTTHTY